MCCSFSAAFKWARGLHLQSMLSCVSSTIWRLAVPHICKAVAKLASHLSCRARKASMQEAQRNAPDAPRRSHLGTRPSATGGAGAGGRLSPALTHGLLRNPLDANDNSSPGALKQPVCGLEVIFYFANWAGSRAPGMGVSGPQPSFSVQVRCLARSLPAWTTCFPAWRCRAAAALTWAA